MERTPLDDLDESWLVLRAQLGDRDAMERLLERLAPPLARFIGRISEPLRDDVTQEVLLTIARKIRWLEDPAALRPWAYRIAAREAWKHLRKEQRYFAADSDDVLKQVPAPEAVPTDPAAADLRRHLARVSPASRLVLVLHYLEELTLDRVAAVLDIPPGTAKSRLAYGLKQLREAMGASPR